MKHAGGLLALPLALALAAGCGGATSDDHDAGCDDFGFDDTDDGSAGGEDQAVPVQLRVVNACSATIDLYVAGQPMPLVRDVQPGQVTSFVGTMLGELHGALEVRNSGDPATTRALATSDPVHPTAGDRATIALRGRTCTIQPLIEHFAAAPGPDALRIRFVDTLGKDTPTRLYWEQADGTFAQAAAVDPLGESGPDGVVVPVAPAGRDSLRVQVAAELSASPGTPGYQLPAAVLKPGAQLFIFARLFSLLVVGPDGPPAEIAVAAGDPPGTIRINPNVAVLNAIPDLCGTGSSHFVFRTADNHMLAAIDVRFGWEGRVVLLPTAKGHTVAVSPLMACGGAGGGSEVISAPLEAGGRYLQVVYGKGAAGAPAGSLRVFSIKDRLPSETPGPAIAVLNAATGAPPLDVALQFPDDSDGGVSTVFSAVALGTASAWVPAPAQDYSLVLLQQPTVSAPLSANQSYLLTAIGDFGGNPTAPVRLVWHKVN